MSTTKNTHHLRLSMISSFLKMKVLKARKTFVSVDMKELLKEGNWFVVENVSWTELSDSLICELEINQVGVTEQRKITLSIDYTLFSSMSELKDYFARIFKVIKGSKF